MSGSLFKTLSMARNVPVLLRPQRAYADTPSPAAWEQKLSLDPPVNGFLNRAYPSSLLSVVESLPTRYLSTYISLRCRNDDHLMLNFLGGSLGYFSNCGFLQLIDEERPEFDSLSEFVAFMYARMAEGYCLRFGTNVFFDPNNRGYRWANRGHEILVCGYENSSKAFRTLEYNRDGVYALGKTSHAALYNAYRTIGHAYEVYRHTRHNDPEHKSRYFLTRLFSFRLSDTYPDQFFYENSFIQAQLKHYLDGEPGTKPFLDLLMPSMDKMEDNDLYGINSYDRVLEYAERVLGDDPKELNKITFYNLWQHKRCLGMLMRRVFDEAGIQTSLLLAELAALETKSKEIHLASMDFRRGKGKGLESMFLKSIGQLAKSERELLERICAAPVWATEPTIAKQ